MNRWPRLGGVINSLSPHLQSARLLPLHDVARALSIRPRFPSPQTAFSISHDDPVAQLDVNELMGRLAAFVSRQGNGTPKRE